MILEKTEEIQNTNEKLEYLIEASLDPIIVCDEKGTSCKNKQRPC